MCNTDNRAVHLGVFLNAQLSSLWEISVACAKNRQTTENIYATALAKYSSGHDFDVTFNKPSLTFVCNHDAILQLCIAEGQYRDVVTSSQSKRESTSIAPGPSGSGETKELKGVEVKFRIPFKILGIQGDMSMVGDSHDKIKLLSLDTSDPKLCFISPSIDEADRKTVAPHLREYLRLLQKAGRHILYCPPEFDDAGLQYYNVNFSSAIEKANFKDVDSVFNISTQEINTFLSTYWNNAGTISDNSSFNGAGLILARYRRTCQNPDDLGPHYKITFSAGSAPTVQVVCAQEVLVTFNIQNISFYEGTHIDSKALVQEFINCKLSFLVTVEHERSPAGRSVIQFVPEKSNCRYMDQFSEFPNYDAHELRARLEDFFLNEYFIASERDKRILYDSDGVPNGPGTNIPEKPKELEPGPDKSDNESDSPEGDSSSSKAIIRQEISATSDVGIFDAIIAIPQAAVNLHFRTCWESSCTKPTMWNRFLTKWAYSNIFEAEFRPITVRLLSNERAIILIHMSTGRLNVGRIGLDKNVEANTFSHWRLAFEVPLVKCTHADIPGVDSRWMERFKQTTVFKDRARATDREFCHIYANLEDAKYVEAFSQFGSSPSGEVQHDMVARMKVTVLPTLTEQYLPLLMTAGYHVLHTVPVWTGGNPPIGAFADFYFRVITKHETVDIPKTLEGHCDDPLIMIAGVGPTKALPELGLPPGWLIRMGGLVPSSAVIISHSLFLEPELLKVFSTVNALTTVVPFFTGLNGQIWETWAEGRKHEPSNFELKNDCSVEGELRYVWQYNDCWEFVPLVNSSSSQQKYTFSCRTDNRLRIPTTYNHALLDIQIDGRVELTTRYGTDQSNIWITGAAVEWGSNLYVKTHEGRLYISIDSAQPIFEQTIPEGEIPDDGNIGCQQEVLLRKHFDKAPDLAGVATLFQQFREPWKSSYPCEGAFNLTHPSFNQKGDLVFELRPLFEPSARPTLRPALRQCSTSKQPLELSGSSGVCGCSAPQTSLRQQPSSAKRSESCNHNIE